MSEVQKQNETCAFTASLIRTNALVSSLNTDKENQIFQNFSKNHLIFATSQLWWHIKPHMAWALD